MDRADWLLDRRAAVRAAYDAEAPTYDEDPYPAGMQRAFVERLLDGCPVDGLVLDAPCGTGRYFPLVAAAGRRVIGIDQSDGMLAVARARGIAEQLRQVGLQELDLVGAVDAAMTIDAMENVFPEDWPRVLANLHAAVRPGGHLYLTVEEVDDAVIDEAFATLSAEGLPVVRGEVIEGDVAGYHYYPGRAQVDRWLRAEGLHVIADETETFEDWGYRHLLVASD